MMAEDVMSRAAAVEDLPEPVVETAGDDLLKLQL
jgi:hypothetical protein